MEGVALFVWKKIHISDSCTCTNIYCLIRQHISDIDNLFDVVCNALRVSSTYTQHCAKTTLNLSHTEIRHYYMLWRDMGKSKHGPIFELMRKTRLHIKHYA